MTKGLSHAPVELCTTDTLGSMGDDPLNPRKGAGRGSRRITVSFFRKLFNREEPEDAPIALDLDRRRAQLLRLEKALDALCAEMRADHTTADPAWRNRCNDYSRLAGQAMEERKGTPTRESLLD